MTPPFGIRETSVPGLAGVADLRQAAFALGAEHPNADRVFSDADSFYVVSLPSREQPDPEKIEAELAATRDRLLQRERALTTALWFTERLKELEAEGKVSQFQLEAQGSGF